MLNTCCIGMHSSKPGLNTHQDTSAPTHRHTNTVTRVQSRLCLKSFVIFPSWPGFFLMALPVSRRQWVKSNMSSTM